MQERNQILEYSSSIIKHRNNEIWGAALILRKSEILRLIRCHAINISIK